MRLNREFYTQDAVTLAPLLLGKVICREWNGEIIKARITETESYMPDDTACHACRGKTLRNAPMFEVGGTSYVYLCYGIHFMFNVVCGEVDSSQAVLIRGVDFEGDPEKLKTFWGEDEQWSGSTATNRSQRERNLRGRGPGKLTKFLKIDRSLNGIDLVDSKELWLEDDSTPPPKYKAKTRIGIDYADEIDRNRLWRFVIE